MNEYNKTETDSNRYREQTSGYQWREERGEGQDSGRELRSTN